jgi:capsular polysaccharide biosynthesis protein
MDNNTLNTRVVFALLRRYWILIVACSVLAAAMAFFFTKFFIPEQYTANVTLYVSNNVDPERNTSTQNYQDYEVSSRLVNNYMELINNRWFLEKVSDNMQNRLSAAQLKSTLSLSQAGETQLLKISATSSSGQLSADICDIVANTVYEYDEYKVPGTSAVIIERDISAEGIEATGGALVPTSPSGPSLPRNTALGIIIGFVLSCAFVFLVYYIDDTVRDEDEFVSYFQTIPVLGEIPTMKTEPKAKTAAKV